MEASDDMVGKEVLVKGWCRTVRDQKAFSFIEVNDGSLPKGIQVLGAVCCTALAPLACCCCVLAPRVPCLAIGKTASSRHAASQRLAPSAAGGRRRGNSAMPPTDAPAS